MCSAGINAWIHIASQLMTYIVLRELCGFRNHQVFKFIFYTKLSASFSNRFEYCSITKTLTMFLKLVTEGSLSSW